MKNLTIVKAFNDFASKNLDEAQNYSKYDKSNFETWKLVFENQMNQMRLIAHPAFFSGVSKLGLTAEKIPVFSEINAKLFESSGWQIYVVDGTLEFEILLYGFLEKKFPVTNFLRSLENWKYTPAPDICHEVIGHLTLLTSEKYGEVLRNFGAVANKYNYSPQVIRLLEPAFWYLVEYVLVQGHGERRIAGPGILSSVGEALEAAVSAGPTIHICGDDSLAQKRFIAQAMRTPVDIEHMQPEYFEVRSFDSYYNMMINHLEEVLLDELKSSGTMMFQLRADNKSVIEHKSLGPVSLNGYVPDHIFGTVCSCGCIHPGWHDGVDSIEIDTNLVHVGLGEFKILDKDVPPKISDLLV